MAKIEIPRFTSKCSGSSTSRAGGRRSGGRRRRPRAQVVESGAGAETRGACFRGAEMLVKNKEEFARRCPGDGKSPHRRQGDVQEAIDMSYYMAGEGRRQFGQTVPSELRNKFAISVRTPGKLMRADNSVEFSMAIPSWKISTTGLRAQP